MNRLNHKVLGIFLLAGLVVLSVTSVNTQAASRRLNRKTMKLDQGKSGVLKMKGVSAGKVKWSTSNKKVATVKKGKVSAVQGGSAVVTAKAGGKKYRCKVTVAGLTAAKVTLAKGGTCQLKLKHISSKKVTWSSSNKKAATVKDGKVTAVQGGSTTITAKVGKKKYRCKVTVVSLNTEIVTLHKGGTYQLKVKNGKDTTWESKDPTIARVSKKGIITARKTGVTYVICRSNKKTLRCKIYVASLDKNTLQMKVDSQYELRTLYYGNKCTYTSGNSAIAEVDDKGLVSALKPGQTTITCTTGKAVLQCKLNIIAPDNITTPTSSLPSSSRKDKMTVTVNGYPSSRTYTIYKQSADVNKTNGEGYVPKSYLPNHGCAVCALTTVFSGFKGMKSGPAKTIEVLEPKMFGKKIWLNNYTRSASKQMPLSLYGISRALSHYHVKNTYVRTLGDPQETNEAKRDLQARKEIEAHLKTGNPVVIEVASYNRSTKKKDTKWANSYHTMVLLGMTDTGKAIVADSADRSDANFGSKKRVKYATVKSLIPYMFSCSYLKGTDIYWGGLDGKNGKATGGGYILVNP